MQVFGQILKGAFFAMGAPMLLSFYSIWMFEVFYGLLQLFLSFIFVSNHFFDFCFWFVHFQRLCFRIKFSMACEISRTTLRLLRPIFEFGKVFMLDSKFENASGNGKIEKRYKNMILSQQISNYYNNMAFRGRAKPMMKLMQRRGILACKRFAAAMRG